MPCSLFVVGDSISIDYGPHLAAALGAGWRYSRKEGEAEALVNLDLAVGANGGDSSRVLAYLEALARHGGFRQDVLLVNAGLHDLKLARASGALQVPLAGYRANLEALIPVARRLTGMLVWVSTTPVDDALHDARKTDFTRRDADVTAYNAAARSIMDTHQVPWLDLGAYTRTLGTGTAIFRDGVHFLNPVKQLQAAYIAGWVHGVTISNPFQDCSDD